MGQLLAGQTSWRASELRVPPAFHEMTHSRSHGVTACDSRDGRRGHTQSTGRRLSHLGFEANSRFSLAPCRNLLHPLAASTHVSTLNTSRSELFKNQYVTAHRTHGGGV